MQEVWSVSRSCARNGTARGLEPMMGLASSRQERLRYSAVAASYICGLEIIWSRRLTTPADINNPLFL